MMALPPLDPTELRATAGRLLALADAIEAAAQPAPAPESDSLRNWYQRYVEQPRSVPPSRDDDLTAARAAGFTEGREVLRELRRELAPASWQLPGRPGKEKSTRQNCQI